jgi:hypothetical protein
MNRPTAILVALATLVAHVMALHQSADGAFAPPYEIAHVAFRAARGLVYEGTLAWNTGGTVVESYPSPLWVALSAGFQSLYVSPTTGSQLTGIACALLTVIVLAQFAANRLAGLVALLLFVVTGTTAAAAASGTEYPLVMLLVASAFLAFERRAPRLTAVLLVLLILARSELWLLVAGLFAAEVVGLRARRAAGGRVLLRPFLAPLLAMVFMAAMRRALIGSWISPTARLLGDLDGERIRLGADYVLSFFLRSGTAGLVVFPLWYLARGQLSGTGRRAMGLVAVWSAFLLLVGGSGLPFWMAMAPAVPPLYLAVQEAMIIAMDSRRRGLSAVTWVAFTLTIVASGLVSRVPTDIGGLPFKDLHQAWMHPSDLVFESYGREYGRRGLIAEINEVGELRSLGVFLRDRLDVGTTVLTPWPGAIGYISRQHVIDLFGRATTPADGSAPRSWYGMPRLDIASSLGAGTDYVVPIPTTATTPPRVGEVVRRWIERNHTVDSSNEEIRRAILNLRGYELISVPVPEHSNLPNQASRHPFYLLRSKGLGLQPRLELRPGTGRSIDVFAYHQGHQQVVDLELKVTDLDAADAPAMYVRPTGELVREMEVHARARILLHPTGQAPIHLMRWVPPKDLRHAEIEAALQNPNSADDPAFALASNRVKIRLGG